MTLPSVAQMACRSNDGHRRALAAVRDRRTLEAWTAGQVRGYRVVLATLRRWACVDGDALTDRGVALLEALEARSVSS